jgi:MOSC domain-containing protein YiiM
VTIPADVRHAPWEDLQAGLESMRAAPREQGVVELIVRRPAVGEREVVSEGALDVDRGLVGDNWSTRGRSGGRPANPNAQITVMSARAAALIAGERERWPLAGDQLYVDFDLSDSNLPPGTRLEVGDAVLEVPVDPHTGCKKFRARFGLDALRFVGSPEGRALNARGINARVVQGGQVRAGDAIRKLGSGQTSA